MTQNSAPELTYLANSFATCSLAELGAYVDGIDEPEEQSRPIVRLALKTLAWRLAGSPRGSEAESIANLTSDIVSDTENYRGC